MNVIDESNQLINPNCAGICLNFQLQVKWDGEVKVHIPNFEMTPQAQAMLGRIFRGMAVELGCRDD